MSKFVAVALTAAVCLPLGALMRGEASAERRMNGLVSGEVLIVGHPHLSKARTSLDVALKEVRASQHASEGVWTDDQGRGTEALRAIENSIALLDRATDWVTRRAVPVRQMAVGGRAR